ncbi:hypothetical protein GCM10010387_29670 [Streptomyces inusitatus]|uniref:Uncharacterized protein n=2 Tax=Streptomyces inusitatus TaxID=68221 RepID=A0A918Q7C4_9ACTN|nr:hypothetical protein GCM10010387_29670 [Streptomyces inusitatus]
MTAVSTSAAVSDRLSGAGADTLPGMSEANLGPERQGLTPRQARHVRTVLSVVVMAAVGAALVLRIGSTHSFLTVGFYGIALILSGSALVLSRQGRTRVATVALGACVALAVAAEWAVASLR